VKKRLKTEAVLLGIIWILLLVLSLVLLSNLVVFFENNSQGQSAISLSWSGYLVSENISGAPIELTSISGSWVIPQINTSSVQGFSSTWIGIGGQFDKTLIQVGTEQDSVNEKDSYSAWYEMLPGLSMRLFNMTVSPGDTIVASISLFDSTINKWNIQISDQTNGQSFNQNFIYNSTQSSGEWIVERPTINNQISNLADFGNITFTNCQLTADNITGSIASCYHSSLQMRDSLSSTLTTVSPLKIEGSSFTVSYRAS